MKKVIVILLFIFLFTHKAYSLSVYTRATSQPNAGLRYSYMLGASLPVFAASSLFGISSIVTIGNQLALAKRVPRNLVGVFFLSLFGASSSSLVNDETSIERKNSMLCDALSELKNGMGVPPSFHSGFSCTNTSDVITQHACMFHNMHIHPDNKIHSFSLFPKPSFTRTYFGRR